MLGYLSSSMKSLVERTVLPQSGLSERLGKDLVPYIESETYKTFKGKYCKLRVTLCDSREWVYYDTGPVSKEPLVCLPGTSGTAEVYFQQALALNLRGYRVVTVTIAAVKSTSEFIQAFKLLLEHLGHGSSNPVHILGTSLGGFLALCFARKCPKWVKSMVLTNAFCDTSLFRVGSGPLVTYSMEYMPEWYLRRFVASPLPSSEADITDMSHAMAIDFVLKQSQQLTRAQLISRVSLNLAEVKIRKLPKSLSPECITIIDPCDSVQMPVEMRAQLYKLLGKAKWCPLKCGGDFPYLANAQSYTMMLQVHLRRNGGFTQEHRSIIVGEASAMSSAAYYLRSARQMQEEEEEDEDELEEEDYYDDDELVKGSGKGKGKGKGKKKLDFDPDNDVERALFSDEGSVLSDTSSKRKSRKRKEGEALMATMADEKRWAQERAKSDKMRRLFGDSEEDEDAKGDFSEEAEVEYKEEDVGRVLPGAGRVVHNVSEVIGVPLSRSVEVVALRSAADGGQEQDYYVDGVDTRARASRLSEPKSSSGSPQPPAHAAAVTAALQHASAMAAEARVEEDEEEEEEHEHEHELVGEDTKELEEACASQEDVLEEDALVEVAEEPSLGKPELLKYNTVLTHDEHGSADEDTKEMDEKHESFNSSGSIEFIRKKVSQISHAKSDSIVNLEVTAELEECPADTGTVQLSAEPEAGGDSKRKVSLLGTDEMVDLSEQFDLDSPIAADSDEMLPPTAGIVRELPHKRADSNRPQKMLLKEKDLETVSSFSPRDSRSGSELTDTTQSIERGAVAELKRQRSADVGDLEKTVSWGHALVESDSEDEGDEARDDVVDLGETTMLDVMAMGSGSKPRTNRSGTVIQREMHSPTSSSGSQSPSPSPVEPESKSSEKSAMESMHSKGTKSILGLIKMRTITEDSSKETSPSDMAGIAMLGRTPEGTKEEESGDIVEDAGYSPVLFRPSQIIEADSDELPQTAIVHSLEHTWSETVTPSPEPRHSDEEEYGTVEESCEPPTELLI